MHERLEHHMYVGLKNNNVGDDLKARTGVAVLWRWVACFRKSQASLYASEMFPKRSKMMKMQLERKFATREQRRLREESAVVVVVVVKLFTEGAGTVMEQIWRWVAASQPRFIPVTQCHSSLYLVLVHAAIQDSIMIFNQSLQYWLLQSRTSLRTPSQ